VNSLFWRALLAFLACPGVVALGIPAAWVLSRGPQRRAAAAYIAAICSMLFKMASLASATTSA
jgi:ABC-type spermidine/putrescine transport system permease subunit I